MILFMNQGVILEDFNHTDESYKKVNFFRKWLGKLFRYHLKKYIIPMTQKIICDEFSVNLAYSASKYIDRPIIITILTDKDDITYQNDSDYFENYKVIYWLGKKLKKDKITKLIKELNDELIRSKENIIQGNRESSSECD